MLNVKFNEPLRETCVMFFCPAYQYIVSLSNNGDLKGPVKCPKIFCDRMKLINGACSKCKQSKPIHQGYYINSAFTCFECDSGIEQKHIEIKEGPAKEVTVSQNKIDALTKELLDKSKNSKFMQYYSDTNKEQQKISFYNPMNTSSLPLVWDFDYVNNSSIEALRIEVFAFFKSFFEHFEDAPSCQGCKYENTTCNGMSCVDCKRNKNSMSILKKDRFKA